MSSIYLYALGSLPCPVFSPDPTLSQNIISGSTRFTQVISLTCHLMRCRVRHCLFARLIWPGNAGCRALLWFPRYLTVRFGNRLTFGRQLRSVQDLYHGLSCPRKFSSFRRSGKLQLLAGARPRRKIASSQVASLLGASKQHRRQHGSSEVILRRAPRSRPTCEEVGEGYSERHHHMQLHKMAEDRK